jgi:ArsR family transcriptional regulator, zinc-responsive transcriptional repressor
MLHRRVCIDRRIRACLYSYVNSDEDALSGAAELFKALSATSRLLILCALAHEPSSVGALTETTKLSQPLVSQHLRLLRGINLVTAARSGRETIYSLTDGHVARVIQDAIAHSQER